MGNKSVGIIDLGLNINSNYFNKQLKGISKGAEKSVKGAFSGMGKMIGAAIGVAAITSFTKSCLELGSNLTEVQNVVDTVFPSMNGQVNEFASNAMTQFGLSETVAKKYMGTLGAMSKSMGMTESTSYEMSSAITGLAGDVASFYNMSSDEAYTKLKSIWTGETESLKELGVVMTQANLDQYAMKMGYQQTTSTMTEQMKLMLRYQYVTSTLASAQGDFAKTSDSWANQVRVLGLRFDSLRATLGQGLINVFSPILKSLNGLIAKLQTAADAFKSFTDSIFGTSSSSSSNSAVSGLVEDTDALTSSTEEAAKAQRNLLGFDKISKIDEPSSSSAQSGGASTPNSGGALQTDTSTISKMSKEFGLLENISFDNLINSFSNLKDSLSNFTSKIWDGLVWGYENLLKPLAKWTIEDALPAFLDLLSGALDFLSTSIEVLEPYWMWLWENFLKPIAKWTGGLFVSIMKELGDALSLISNNKGATLVLDGLIISLLAFKVGTEGYKALEFLTTKLSKLSTMGKIAVVVTVAVAGFEIGKSINELLTGEESDATMSEFFSESFDAIKNDDFWPAIKMTANDAWTSIRDSWDTNVVDNTKGGLEELGWNFAQAWDGTKSKFSEVAGGLKAGAGEIGWHFGQAWDGTKNKAGQAWDGIKSIFGNVGEFFGGVNTGIQNAFGSIGNWLKTTFFDAWTGVKNVFSAGGQIFDGIKDGISSVFKTVVNGLIGGINAVISLPFKAINKMLNKIRDVDVMGFTPFDGLWDKNPLTVPKIPMLAQGGYVRANQPQLAMIGDNRHQGEVVAPEDKLKQMAREVLAEGGGRGYDAEILLILKEILKALKELNIDIVIDGKKLKDIIVEKINQNTKQTGVCEILV